MTTSVSVALLATSSIFLALAIAAVVLRLIVRRRSNGSLGKDDWLIVAALFFATGLCLTNIIGVPVGHYGFEFKEDDLNSEYPAKFLKFTFAWQYFYILAVTAVKLSILFFYGRFFRSTSFKRVQLALICLVCAWAAAFVLCTIFQIWPITCNWTDCNMTMNYPAMYVATSATDIALDMAILAIPLVMLAKIQVSKGKRTALAIIFSLGAFCIVASVFRLAYTIVYLHYVYPDYLDFGFNFSGSALAINMWSGIEACASIIGACLPCIGPYMSRVRFIRRMVDTTRGQFWQNGTSDRFTGGAAGAESSRSRGRTRSRRLGALGLGGSAVGDDAVDAEAKDLRLLRSSSTEKILPMLMFFGASTKQGEPTYRHDLEPEIEMGKISLRTGSSSGETLHV